jgi:hypothetical protein
MRRYSSLLFVPLILAAFGCSLLVDTSELDAGCPEGTKLCPGAGCVAIDDPAYGCRPDTCTRCPNVLHAVAVCVENSCSGVCLEGFGCSNCTANLLADEDNCGGCCGGRSPCEFDCEDGEYCQNGTCVSF